MLKKKKKEVHAAGAERNRCITGIKTEMLGKSQGLYDGEEPLGQDTVSVSQALGIDQLWQMANAKNSERIRFSDLIS